MRTSSADAIRQPRQGGLLLPQPEVFKCNANELEHSFMLLHDRFIADPEDPKTQALKVPVPTGVRGNPVGVIPAVHFHDEPDRRGNEVSDVTTNDNLAPKRHAQLGAGQRLPEPRLRDAGRCPKRRGTAR